MHNNNKRLYHVMIHRLYYTDFMYVQMKSTCLCLSVVTGWSVDGGVVTGWSVDDGVVTGWSVDDDDDDICCDVG